MERNNRKSRTSLGRSHEIAAGGLNDGDGVLLDGGGLLVAREENVGHEQLVQLGLLEGRDGGRSALALELNVDRVVLVKVDTSVGTGEEDGLVGQILRNQASSTVPLANSGISFSAARRLLSVTTIRTSARVGIASSVGRVSSIGATASVRARTTSVG